MLPVIGYLPMASCSESDVTQAEKFFLEGRYDKAIYESQALIDSRARHRDELYYIKGLSELKTAKYDDARQSFEELLLKYPGSKRALDAGVGMGDAYFLEARYNDASRHYKEALSKYPNDRNICIVNQKLAECYKKLRLEEDTKAYVKTEAASCEPLQSAQVSVQVGSFKSGKNADKLSQKLRRAGYDSFVDIPSGDRLYRVKVGRFKSRQDAEAIAARLKKSGYSVKICAE
jgi:tetratricopeptide (TPR) repeat protein